MFGGKNNKDSPHHSLLAPRGTTMNKYNSRRNILENLPTLGLTLTVTPCFVKLIEETLSKQEAKKAGAEEQAKAKHDKHKASNFPAKMIRIGSWEVVALNESHLVAKCYYAKKKLVWEVMKDGLKNKMEIQWSEISAIRATMVKDEDGILELELTAPPTFSREHFPQPGKHSSWYQCGDFTGDQASTCRIHYLRFAPGFLDGTYRTLLCYDLRLFELSHKPFPSDNNPYFSWNPIDYMQYIAPAQDQAQSQLDNFGQLFITEIPENMTMSNQIPRIETTMNDAPNVAYYPSQMPGNDLAFGEQGVTQFPGKPAGANPWSPENNFAQVITTENSDSQYNLYNLASSSNVTDYTETYNLDIANLSKSQEAYLQNFLGHNSNKEALAIFPTSSRVNPNDGQSYQQPPLSNPIQFFDNPNMMMDQPNFGIADAPPRHSHLGGRLNNHLVANQSRDMVYNQMDQWNKATSQAHLDPAEGF